MVLGIGSVVMWNNIVHGMTSMTLKGWDRCNFLITYPNWASKGSIDIYAKVNVDGVVKHLNLILNDTTTSV